MGRASWKRPRGGGEKKERDGVSLAKGTNLGWGPGATRGWNSLLKPGCFKASAFLPSFGVSATAFSSGLECKSLALAGHKLGLKHTGMCGKGLGAAQRCEWKAADLSRG